MSEWRNQLQEMGREAFILHEMQRLGFWPDNSAEDAGQATAALARLAEINAELAELRNQLQKLRLKLQTAEEVTALIAKIRQARIQRVQARREVRRLEKAQEAAKRREAFLARRSRTPFFLGERVSKGLRFSDTPDPRLRQNGLPELVNAEELAAAIDVTPGKLQWLCFDRTVSTVDHYRRFQIPKRSGAMRSIASPKPLLRKAQDWIRLNVLSKMVPHERVAMAFRPGKSIADNAKPHAGKAIVVRIDLKDFFPTINFARAKGLFQYVGYNEGVATLLALLCTEAPRAKAVVHGKTYYVATGPRVLPQGACTSPDLSNFICRKLDVRLDGFAKSLGFTYTRYADDLVFSHDEARGNATLLIRVACSVIAAEGFEPNHDKTAIMRRGGRQVVTGLVVNDVPKVSRRDTRRFRAIAHKCRTDGYVVVSESLGCDARSYLKGYLSFVSMVNEVQALRLERLCPPGLFDM